MVFGRRFWQTSAVVVLSALISGSVFAQSVTTRLVVGGGSATSTKVVPGGSTSMDVRLDIVTASIFVTAFRLSQMTPGTSGFFSITGRSFAGSPFDDTASGTPDATVLAPASALLDADNNDNLGRNTIGLVGIPPANNVLAVNLTLTASAATPFGTYTILPTPGASFATATPLADFSMSTGTPFSIVVGQTLSVTKSGTGTGTVSANSGAINCGATCSDIYPGTVVTLTATPTAGSALVAWTGACSGTGSCVVTVDAAKTVNAQFDTDVAPPDTTINSGPTDPSSDPTPIFTFSSTEPNSTFRCSLDGAPFTACTSPRQVVVGNGSHTFQVAATDAAGNTDPTPASFGWTAAGIVAPPQDSRPIPTLNEWMLLLLALVIGSFGVAASRRRN